MHGRVWGFGEGCPIGWEHWNGGHERIIQTSFLGSSIVSQRPRENIVFNVRTSANCQNIYLEKRNDNNLQFVMIKKEHNIIYYETRTRPVTLDWMRSSFLFSCCVHVCCCCCWCAVRNNERYTAHTLNTPPPARLACATASAASSAGRGGVTCLQSERKRVGAG